MKKYTVDLLTQFVENFEEEIHLKNKIESSHANQLAKMGILLENFLYQSGLEIKPSKLASGPNPTLHVKFRRKLTEIKLLEVLKQFFIVNNINFKSHSSEGSLSMFSVKNDSVPGLLEGVGFSLFSIYSPSTTGFLGIKLEILVTNQIVKILDAGLENLSLLIWTGRTLKKSTFKSPFVNVDFSAEMRPDVLDLEMISESKSNPIKIRANFTKSNLLGYTLEKILEIQKI
jgi:hypothetical protein